MTVITSIDTIDHVGSHRIIREFRLGIPHCRHRHGYNWGRIWKLEGRIAYYRFAVNRLPAAVILTDRHMIEVQDFNRHSYLTIT